MTHVGRRDPQDLAHHVSLLLADDLTPCEIAVKLGFGRGPGQVRRLARVLERSARRKDLAARLRATEHTVDGPPVCATIRTPDSFLSQYSSPPLGGGEEKKKKKNAGKIEPPASAAGTVGARKVP